MFPILWVRSSPLHPQYFGSDHHHYLSNPLGQIITVTFWSDHRRYIWVRSSPLHPQSFGSDHRHYIPRSSPLPSAPRFYLFYISRILSSLLHSFPAALLFCRHPSVQNVAYLAPTTWNQLNPFGQIIAITLNTPVLLILYITHTFFTITLLPSSSALLQTP